MAGKETGEGIFCNGVGKKCEDVSEMNFENYSVKPIPSKETYDWLLNKHYAHRIPRISYAFGLYDDNKLVGVCTFGMPANNFLCEGICGVEYKNIVVELNRLVIECDKTNILSFFVGKCIKYLDRPKIIVSYADNGNGHHGYIYQATNFLFTGTTAERTEIFTGNGKHSRHYNKNTIDYSNRIKRTAKHRYIYFIGSKKEKKEMLKALKYPILPYPKGDNKRYDASYQPKVQGVLF